MSLGPRRLVRWAARFPSSAVATETFLTTTYTSSTIPPNVSAVATETFLTTTTYTSSTIPPNVSVASPGTSKSW